jgi:DNA polymerase-3 subunit epsilon
MDYKLVALDTETTGFSAAHGHRICEIGIVVFDETGIQDKFVSIINPKRDIPWAVSRVHGIDSKLASRAPSFSDVSGHIADYLNGGIVIAHNATFDIRFLQAEFNRLGMHTRVPYVCSCATSRRYLKGPANYQLGTIASYLGLADFSKHTALEDAEACAKIMMHLLEANPALRNRVEEQAAHERTSFDRAIEDLPRNRPLTRQRE